MPRANTRIRVWLNRCTAVCAAYKTDSARDTRAGAEGPQNGGGAPC